VVGSSIISRWERSIYSSDQW